MSSVEVISGGVWIGPVLIQDLASSATVSLANEIARILDQMAAGMAVIMDPPPGTPGIALVVLGDLDTEYEIATDPVGVTVAGRTDQDLDHATWLFLRKLGYKALGTTPEWVIVPSHRELDLDLEIAENRTLRFVTGIGSSGGVLVSAVDRISITSLLSNS